VAGLPPKIHRRYAAMGRDVDEVTELLERLDNGTGEPLYREIPVNDEPEVTGRPSGEEIPKVPEPVDVRPLGPQPMASEDVKIEERGNAPEKIIIVEPKPERKVGTSWKVSRHGKKKRKCRKL